MADQEKEAIKIYLDYNATTPVAPEVVTSIERSLIFDWANPSSTHVFGFQAKGAVNKARHQIAEMLHVPSTEIIFTSGGTEANNMIINSVLPYYEEFKKDSNSLACCHVITSNVEHDSVILPIKYLASKKLLEYTEVKVNNNGCINVEDIIKAIKENTCLVTIMAANNETGVIMPVSDIGAALHSVNSLRMQEGKPEVLFHSDAAQIIGKAVVHGHDLNVDYLTIVGHKFQGPRIGAVWAKTKLYPLLFGGGQEGGVRPGTENTAMMVGLGKAAELVSFNAKIYMRNMLSARDYLEQRLKKEFGDGVVINCSSADRLVNTSSVAFVGEGLTGRKILSKCQHLIAGVGAACHDNACSQVLLNSGVTKCLAVNTVRLSVGRETSYEDIDNVIADLRQAVDSIQLSAS